MMEHEIKNKAVKIFFCLFCAVWICQLINIGGV